MRPRGAADRRIKILPWYWVRGARQVTRAEELRQALKDQDDCGEDTPGG